MHTFAIFAVNEHIAELQAEAARARLHGDRRPSPLRAFVAAVIAAVTGPATPVGPLHAFHASK